MYSNTKFPAELTFLTELLEDRKNQYKQAYWLKSPFEAVEWKCDLLNKFNVNFRVQLNDRSYLTEPQHRALLNTFKAWICIQTHYDMTEGKKLAPKSAYDRVTRTMRLIDYLLLNSRDFDLASCGLNNLTENDFFGLMYSLASSSNASNSVYRWSERLTDYLRSNIATTSKAALDLVIESNPSLRVIDTEFLNHKLNLTDDELIHARAYLLMHGMYKKSKQTGYRFSPNTQKLAKILYQNTLRGMSSKPIFEELCFDTMENYDREYPAVPIKSRLEDQLSEKELERYKRSLRSLGLLGEIGYPIPTESLRGINNRAVQQALNLKSAGHFRTLPHHVVFPALRNAIEFIEEYGEDLVSSYLSLTHLSVDVSCQVYANKNDIKPIIRSKVRAMGVHTWGLNDHMDMVENCKLDHCKRASKSIFFKRLRANEGLHELIRVLYGAAQISIGILMARRQGELLDLNIEKCLDVSATQLIFYNRKSGVNGKRDKALRPIPAVCVKMIKLFKYLQSELIKMGLLEDYTNLFASPTRLGSGVSLSSKSYNKNLDYFCDYFETTLDENGKRHYIRQHQLRRFFAMTFFWSSAFGGLDTLRWMLGHTDVEHVYYYIVENTPGEVLRSIKTEFALELVKKDHNEAKKLSDLLESHYGTRNFSVLDSDELEEYIEELILEEQVHIEPEFFHTPDGNQYKILINVIDTPHV